MTKQLPHWKDNKQVMKLELLHAIDNANYYDDDLFEDVSQIQEGESNIFDLDQLGRSIRKNLTLEDRDLTKNTNIE